LARFSPFMTDVATEFVGAGMGMAERIGKGRVMATSAGTHSAVPYVSSA